jgi:hypothetical protein
MLNFTDNMRRIHKDREWTNHTRTYQEYMDLDARLMIGYGINRDEWQRLPVNSGLYRYPFSSRDRLDLQAQSRASYYIWCIRRGHFCAGNDPLTGRKRNDRGESRAVYIAQALYWIRKYRFIMKGYRSFYTPIK